MSSSFFWIAIINGVVSSSLWLVCIIWLYVSAIMLKAVAAALACDQRQYNVVFITHASHRVGSKIAWFECVFFFSLDNMIALNFHLVAVDTELESTFVGEQCYIYSCFCASCGLCWYEPRCTRWIFLFRFWRKWALLDPWKKCFFLFIKMGPSCIFLCRRANVSC